jgi:hypothetical protein
VHHSIATMIAIKAIASKYLGSKYVRQHCEYHPFSVQPIVFFGARAVPLGPVPRNVVGATCASIAITSVAVASFASPASAALGLGSSTAVVPSPANKSLF